MAFKPSRDFPAPYLARSKSKGMSRLVKAAEKGDADSQFNLGVVYDNELDDNHHPAGAHRTEAIRWLSKAARQGLPRAQNKLAELYAGGPDAPKDDVRACAWFALAARNSTGINRRRAEVGYSQLAARMTQAQISRAAGLVRDWMPKRQDEVAAPAIAGNRPEKDAL
jgi:TPR repeat protein